jgi:hypothetical protein
MAGFDIDSVDKYPLQIAPTPDVQIVRNCSKIEFLRVVAVGSKTQ